MKFFRYKVKYAVVLEANWKGEGEGGWATLIKNLDKPKKKKDYGYNYVYLCKKKNPGSDAYDMLNALKSPLSAIVNVLKV